MDAPITNKLPAPGIHLPDQGGILIGYSFINGSLYGCVSPAPGDYSEISGKYHHDYTDIDGASSMTDAVANTAALRAAGSPIAMALEGLVINGHSDWAIASKLDAAMAHANAPHVLPKHWIHTSSQFSAHLAWFQHPNGNQIWYFKDYEGAVLPVRRFLVIE